jgi:hypothetical protein
MVEWLGEGLAYLAAGIAASLLTAAWVLSRRAHAPHTSFRP